MNNRDELKHYGVLGMKWGQRIHGKNYVYKSIGQRSTSTKYKVLNKLSSKSDSVRIKNKVKKLEEKLNIIKKRDQNRQDYVKTVKVGEALIKDIIYTPLGAGNYHRLRSAGVDRTLSKSVGANTSSFNVLKNIDMTIETRKREFDTAKKTNNTVNDKKSNNKTSISKKPKIQKYKNNDQKVYDKFHADDIEGIVKNMSKSQLNDLNKHVSPDADWPEIQKYVMKKYR